ncbi:MAG: ribosome biogenesis GTP-binding protein YihA/YsxC [Armatimonadota bacterium]
MPKITHLTVELATTAFNLKQFPPATLPEIAFAGRSNVGKSSLINRLLARTGLARTSKTPGRTQSLNFYRVRLEVDGEEVLFFLVDMPGYGFSKAGAEKQRGWKSLVDSYLGRRESLRGVIQLIDLRHPPQPLDHQMAEWLLHYKHHFIVVGTKADKIAKTKVPEHLKVITDNLGLDEASALAFSSETGFGRDELWQWIITSVTNEEASP